MYEQRAVWFGVVPNLRRNPVVLVLTTCWVECVVRLHYEVSLLV